MEASTYAQTGRSCRGARRSGDIVTSRPRPVFAVPAGPFMFAASLATAVAVCRPSVRAASLGNARNASAAQAWHVQLKRTQKTDVLVVDNRRTGFTHDIAPEGPPRSSSSPA